MFEWKEGKLVHKSNGEQDAGNGNSKSVALKLEGDRLKTLQRILKESGWTNPAKATATDATKWYQEQTSLRIVAFKLMDRAIEQYLNPKPASQQQAK